MMNVRALGGVVLVSLLLSGCGPTDPTDMEEEQDFHPTAEMVGTWIFQFATVDGVAASLTDVLEWLPGTVESRLHIQANGAYVYEEVNSSGGQVWFESGFVIVNTEINEFELNSQLDSDGAAVDVVTATYTLVAGVFTLEVEEFGTTTVYTLGM
jgi:hypothetical protein